MLDDYTTLRMGAKRFWWAFAAGFADIVVFFPILAIVAASFVSPGFSALWIASVFVNSALGTAVVARWPKTSTFSVLALAALFAIPAALIFSSHQVGVDFVPPVIVGMLATFLAARHWRLDTGLTNVSFYVTGLAVDFGSVFAFHHVTAWHSWVPGLTVSGIIGIGIVLFSMNINSLESMLLTRDINRGLPKRMVRFNYALAACAVLILWAVFGIRALQRAAAMLWNRLLIAIEVLLRRVNDWLASLFRTKAPPHHARPKALPSHKHPAIPPKPVHPSILSYVIMGILAAVALTLVVWSIARFLIPLLRRLFQDFNAATEGEQAGYVDEFESLRPARRRRRLLPNFRRQTHVDEPMPSTPGEWVRYLYRKTAQAIHQRSGEWDPSFTVEEVLALSDNVTLGQRASGGRNQLERLYNEARYGDGRIAQEEVARLRREFEDDTE